MPISTLTVQTRSYKNSPEQFPAWKSNHTKWRTTLTIGASVSFSLYLQSRSLKTIHFIVFHKVHIIKLPDISALFVLQSTIRKVTFTIWLIRIDVWLGEMTIQNSAIQFRTPNTSSGKICRHCLHLKWHIFFQSNCIFIRSVLSHYVLWNFILLSAFPFNHTSSW